MGKKLAIKGHLTRREEVIELLEMLGGKDSNAFRCTNPNLIYFVLDNHVHWDYIGPEEIDKYEIFTLEEFFSKYPFKIGDKVLIPEYESEVRICRMNWDGFEIQYKVYRNDEEEWYTAEELLNYNDDFLEDVKPVNDIKPLFKAGDVVKLKGCPDKNFFWIVMDVVKDGYIFNGGEKCSFDDQHHYEKSNREVINPQLPKMKNVLAELLEHINTTPKEELEREFEEIKEWSNVGPTVEEFMTFCESVNKKPKKPIYPTTYTECKNMIPKNVYYGYSMFMTLQNLIICRDVYWDIYGKQTGLGKPWKPDWNNHNQPKFGIHTVQNNIRPITLHVLKNLILVFPTEEIRDIFYENFKEAIEHCKELL